MRIAQSPGTVTSSFSSHSAARTSAGCSGPSPESRSASTARPVSQTGDWHASGRSRSPSSTMKPCQPSIARESVSSSGPWPSAASIRIDQTHGGWIPPHEPSASWCARTHASAVSSARRRRLEGGAGRLVWPGREPISRRSMSAGRTGCRARQAASGTNVPRAQQEKL